MRYVPSDLPSEHVDRTFTGQAESAARPRDQKAGCMKEDYYYLLVPLSQIFYAVSVPYISARFCHCRSLARTNQRPPIRATIQWQGLVPQLI